MTHSAPHTTPRDADAGLSTEVLSLQEQVQRQREEIAELKVTIRGLESEIKGLRGSFYWALTRPLRSLARRLPGVAAGAQRTLDRAKDSLVMFLPKRASQTLFEIRWDVGDAIEEQIASYRGSRTEGRRIVFYTAIFGEYDNLLLPEVIDPCIDYVCFTDRPRNDYGIWQVRSAPYSHPDPTRIARWVKMHPNELFPDHEVAVWLDANIVLKGDLRRYVDMFEQQEADLGLIAHPHRSCFYDEAEACKQLNKDTEKLIDRQINEYRKAGLPPKQPLFETGFMIVPLKRQGTAEALHLWWQQIERFSRRDQLGLAWVTYRNPGLRIVPLLPEGASVRDHEDFLYFRHSFAQALTIPEVLLKAGNLVSPSAGSSPDRSSPSK